MKGIGKAASDNINYRENQRFKGIDVVCGGFP